MKLILFLFFQLLLLLSCDVSKLSQTPMEKFKGNWQIFSTQIMDGVEVKIKEEDGRYRGHISKLNNHKFVIQSLNIGDVYIENFKRRSNFQFIITVNRLQNEVLEYYKVPSTEEFEIVFEGNDTIVASGKTGKFKMVRLR